MLKKNYRLNSLCLSDHLPIHLLVWLWCSLFVFNLCFISGWYWPWKCNFIGQCFCSSVIFSDILVIVQPLFGVWDGFIVLIVMVHWSIFGVALSWFFLDILRKRSTIFGACHDSEGNMSVWHVSFDLDLTFTISPSVVFHEENRLFIFALFAIASSFSFKLVSLKTPLVLFASFLQIFYQELIGCFTDDIGYDVTIISFSHPFSGMWPTELDYLPGLTWVTWLAPNVFPEFVFVFLCPPPPN